MRRLLTLVLICILLLLNLNFIRGSLQSYEKLSEINKEQGKVNELEIKNSELHRELKNQESTYFIEQEARNRLGYSKVGETTIVVESSEISKAAKAAQKEQKSNLKAWLDLVTN